MSRSAALLRGVNVGGRPLRMADLRTALTAIGLRDVQTLLASGNAVFEGEASEARIERALGETLKLETHVLLRSADELQAIVAANPFPAEASARPQHLLVVVHRAPFPADALVRLGAIYDGPERLVPHGRELFIDFPDGIGRSKLVAAMVKAKFPAVATGRNWNTILKLAAATCGDA